MLLHITQTHTPETCPVGEGGMSTLFDANAPGIQVIARYAAHAEHTMFFIVEAEDMQAVTRFLLPGFKRCHADITPVSVEAVQR